VKREDFVSEPQRSLAFTDVELPLANGSLMLQPKQEARMVQDLTVGPEDKVLEIGTVSGYVTALLASLAQQVFSVEIDARTLEQAQHHLQHAGIKNVTLSQGNGLEGLGNQAPFNVIFVGGSVPVIPEILKNQLAIGGRMVVPVGDLPVMALHLIKRISQDAFSDTIVYETCIARLQGCEAIEPQRFVF
jgi:protein-L-isoaspartate(D-aspartate) O-methyltransferase